MELSSAPKLDLPAERSWAGAFQILGIATLFGLLCWSPPPDVNEAHYLCKARHFWNPAYCPEDLFLGSANAHWLFLASFGILANAFPLDIAAWIGRLICWVVLAMGWRHLARNMGLSAGWILLSAAGMIVFNRIGHLAGEWVAGGAEAKTIAYGCVFFALGDLVSRRYFRGWALLGVAVAFHGLVGAWSALAVGFALLPHFREFSSKSFWLGVLVFLAISAISIWPAWSMNHLATSEQLAAGYSIQVFQRLDHHQFLFSFAPERWLAFAVLLAVWFVVVVDTPSARERRTIVGFSLGALVFSLLGVLGSIAESAALLRFYCFRLADVAIPATLVLLLPGFLKHRFSQHQVWVVSGVVGLIGLAIVNHSFQKWRDPRPGSDRQSLPAYAQDTRRTYETYLNWVRVCEWITAQTPPDAVFLTPMQQQTFKWHAQRSEVVCWKDAPQDVIGLLEWNQRMELPRDLAGSGYGLLYLTDQQLVEYARRYQATYIVAPQAALDLRELDGDPVRLELVYPESPNQRSTYVVLKVPSATVN